MTPQPTIDWHLPQGQTRYATNFFAKENKIKEKLAVCTVIPLLLQGTQRQPLSSLPSTDKLLIAGAASKRVFFFFHLQ